MPTLDSSTPAFVTGTANPATTASFTPPANAALFAICLADELNTFVISNTGTTLSWASIGTPISQSGEGSIAVFRAYTGNSSPGAITVSSTRTGSFTANGLQVLVFTNTEAVYTGAYATALAATVNLTTTGTNSWIWAGHIEENGTTDPAASNCAYNNGPTTFGGIAGGVLKRTATTPASGTVVTIGVTGVTIPDIVAFEVKDAGTSATTTPGQWPNALSPGIVRANHETAFSVPFQLLGDATAVTQTNYVKTPGDPVGITDAVSVARGTSLSDPEGVTDAVKLARGATVTDAVGVTDARTLARGTTVSDPEGITDSSSRVVAVTRAPADPVGITDSVKITRGKTQSDAVGITDTASGLIVLLKTVSDPIGITDSRTLSRSTSPGDAVGVTDAVTRSMTYVRTVTDAVGVTDLARSGDTEGLSDSEGLTDSVKIARGKSITDPEGITDGRTLAVGKGKTDPVGLTDSRTLARVVVISDAVGVTDGRTQMRGFVVVIGDSVGITDGAFRPGTIVGICVTLASGPKVDAHTVRSPRVQARTASGPRVVARLASGPRTRPLLTSEGVVPRTITGPASC